MGLFAKFFGGMPLKQIKALAELGNVAAQSEIGTMYEAVQDNVQAAYWYRQAADQGDADAKDKLERIIAELSTKNDGPISDTNFGKRNL